MSYSCFLSFLAVGALATCSLGCDDPPGPLDAAPADAGVPVDAGLDLDASGDSGVVVVEDASLPRVCPPSLWGTASAVLAPPSPYRGVVIGDLLTSLPELQTPLLRTLPAVSLAGGRAAHVELPVRGEVPGGTAEAWAYDSEIDRIVATVVAPFGLGGFFVAVELVQIEPTGATFTVLRSAGMPFPASAWTSSMIPLGGQRYLVLDRASASAEITIDLARGEATWGERHELDPAAGPWREATATTPGDTVVVGREALPDGTARRTVSRLASTAAGPSFTPIALAGVAPTLSRTEPWDLAQWALYDRARDRVLVLDRDVDHTVFWAASLSDGTWSTVVDPMPPFGGYAIADRAGTLTSFGWNGQAFSLEPGAEGTMTAPAGADFLLPDTNGAADAVRLPDGRFLERRGDGTLLSLDPSASPLDWQRAGAVAMPATLSGGSLVYDPVHARLLVFAPRWMAGMEDIRPTTRVLAANLDGSGLTALTTTGDPPGRDGYSLLVIDAELVIVGGHDAATYTPLDDVWALDLATLAWRRVGTLPEGRAAPGLRPLPGRELLVAAGMGVVGRALVGVPSAVAMNLDTGHVRVLDVRGPRPWLGGIITRSAPIGDGLVALDVQGDLGGPAYLWLLRPEGAAWRWVPETVCAPASVLAYSALVEGDPGEAWALGAWTWRLGI